MTKLEKKQVIGLLSCLILAVFCIYLYRYTMLKDTKKTCAVFVEYNIGGGNTQKVFKFNLRNEIIRAFVTYTESIKIGDTVCIEYSIQNPEVIKVIGQDCRGCE